MLTRVGAFNWRKWGGPLVILVVVVLFYHPLLTGSFPLSHDHPAHMFNAWLTSDVLLKGGSITGWSDLWFAGYPANELYGPGGNLYVSFVRYVTLGMLDYGTTYGLAMFGLMLLIPMSIYALGRALLGPGPALIAALLMTVTRGGWYDLGWFWVVEMGVWPFALGTSLTFISIVVVRHYLRSGGPGWLLGAGVSITAAVMGHPMSLPLLAMAMPLLMGHLMLERGRKSFTLVMLRAAAAGALGVALAAAWLVPFITKSGYSQQLGETWMEMGQIITSVAQLDLFGPEWRLVTGLAGCGIVIAMARRNIWAIYIAALAILMAVVASSTTLYNLRLLDMSSSFASIQYPRFVGVIRVLAYLLCGYAIVEFWRMSAPLRETIGTFSRKEFWRSVVAVSIPVILCLPFIPSLARYARINHTVDGMSLRTQKTLDWWGDFQETAEYLKMKMADHPGARIAAFGQESDHIFSLLPIYTGLPVYTGGPVPAHTYRFFFLGEQDIGTVRALGAKYAIATNDWGSKLSGVTLKKTFGPIRVYEIEDLVPTLASPVGDCSVSASADAEGGLDIVVSRAKGPCRIRIHRSDYPNWQAEFDGQAITIERIPAHRGSTYAAFMSVLAPGNGSLRIGWVSTRGDIAGASIALTALIIALLLLWFSFKSSHWERLIVFFSPSSEGTRYWATRGVWSVVGVIGVSILAVCLLRASEYRYTFDRHLNEAERTVEVRGERIPCRKSDSDSWVCGQSWDMIRSGFFSFVYDNRYCIFAHPSPQGPKHLTFKDVPLKSRLSGFYGLLDSSRGRGTVNMDITVGDAPPVRFSTRETGYAIGFDMPTQEGIADVEVTVTATQPDWRHLCFNIQVLAEDEDG
ncbi:MAG TPA: hypothetical protein EYN06_10485 [Myxococcales bacterium]|nr:hypothetical protein [Myxococcales bacterium]